MLCTNGSGILYFPAGLGAINPRAIELDEVKKASSVRGLEKVQKQKKNPDISQQEFGSLSRLPWQQDECMLSNSN